MELTENFKNRFGVGYICTDPSTFQFGKKIDDDRYIFIEADHIDLILLNKPNNMYTLDNVMDACEMIEGDVDLTEYSEEEQDRIASSYHVKGLAELKETYGNLWKWVMAECIFEYETQY